jgi:hypothetical protein
MIVTLSPNNGSPETGVPMLLSCPVEDGALLQVVQNST